MTVRTVSYTHLDVYKRQVLACVGVPTVRKIEVELLMRAKNRSALPLLLEKVRAWLEESGEEKLHFDSMGGTYYKARCTGTEAPTYSGASARLKVTFTCVDYRRYRLYDDKPVGGADPVSYTHLHPRTAGQTTQKSRGR